MKSIAIIPARSGSKRLPHKNIKLLLSKPLISYTIEAAIQSQRFDVVFVSTDSEEYAQISRKFGADVPFIRSEDNSGDQSSSWAVVDEVLEYYRRNGQTFDVVALLQPTSPLRTSDDIIGAFEEMDKKNAKTIISVCPSEHSPLLMNTLPENKTLHNFIDLERIDAERALSPEYFRINGAIYLMQYSSDFSRNDLYGDRSFAYIMPKERSIDIDTQMDFDIAEHILKQGSGGEQ